MPTRLKKIAKAIYTPVNLKRFRSQEGIFASSKEDIVNFAQSLKPDIESVMRLKNCLAVVPKSKFSSETRRKIVLLIRSLRADGNKYCESVVVNFFVAKDPCLVACRERALYLSEAGQILEARQAWFDLLDQGDIVFVLKNVRRFSKEWRRRGLRDALLLSFEITYFIENAEMKGELSALKELFSRDSEGEFASLKLMKLNSLSVSGRFSEFFSEVDLYLEKISTCSVGARKVFGVAGLREFVRYVHAGSSDAALPSPLIDNRTFLEYIGDLETNNHRIRKVGLYQEYLKACKESRKVRSSLLGRRSKEQRDNTNLLIVADNWNFISKEIDGLESEYSQEVNIRTIDLKTMTVKTSRNYLAALYDPFFQDGESICALSTINEYNKSLLDSADTIFLEWCNESAVFFSRYLKSSDKKVVVRLHSYEAFSHWPYFVNWGAVDELVFVAEHIKNVFLALHPEVIELGVNISVINTFHNFDVYLESGDQSSPPVCHREKTLCMLGWATPNKDPIWTLEVLSQLLKEDPEWKLLLVGNTWRESEPDQSYIDTFNRYIDENELHQAIEFVPYTNDISPQLLRAGYVVSASHREGTHEAIIEGVGHGCIPVIRDWPMLTQFGGARDFYRCVGDNICETPAEAAALILDRPFIKNYVSSVQVKARDTFHYENTLPRLVEVIAGE